MDLGTGRILYEQNPDQQIPPASLTKIITLYLTFEALQEHRLSFTDTVLVSREASMLLLHHNESELSRALLSALPVDATVLDCTNGLLGGYTGPMPSAFPSVIVDVPAYAQDVPAYDANGGFTGMDALVGQDFEFKILKINRRRSNVIVSRRVLLEEQRSEQRGALLETLAEGQVVKGKVKNITEYGVFIDLGGLDGLLHITDMGKKRHLFVIGLILSAVTCSMLIINPMLSQKLIDEVITPHNTAKLLPLLGIMQRQCAYDRCRLRLHHHSPPFPCKASDLYTRAHCQPTDRTLRNALL